MIASGKMLAEQLSAVSHQPSGKSKSTTETPKKFLTAEIAKRAEIA